MEAIPTISHQIKHRDGRVLFECDLPGDTPTYIVFRMALEKATRARADMRGADMRNCNMSGAVMSGAVMRGADLSNCNMRGADMRGTDLSNCNMCRADMRGTDMRYADMRGTDMRGADLSNCNMRGSDMRGTDLRNCNMGRSFLSNADLILRATPEQSIENLDKVRAIILSDKARLKMSHWHGGNGWFDRTSAEEAVCGTTHCLAGWLQVCSTNLEIRKMDSELAGILSAPVAAKMFFREAYEVMDWLEKRAYVNEAKGEAA